MPTKDKEKRRIICKRYYDKNKEKHKLWVKNHREKNREMYRMAVKKYYKRNKIKINEYNIKNRYKKYGMLMQDVIEMIKTQNGLCGCCGSKLDEIGFNKKVNKKSIYRPQVDHDHSSFKVRGIICGSCNLLLGHAYDDISKLEKAIIYLSKHKTISSTTTLN